MKPLRAEIRNHFLRIRKPIVIPGERPVTVEMMDIEPDDVGRNFLHTEGISEQAHARFGVITPTALIVAQRPAWRKWHVTGQSGVTLSYLFRVGTVDEIIIEITAHCAKG